MAGIIYLSDLQLRSMGLCCVSATANPCIHHITALPPCACSEKEGKNTHTQEAERKKKLPDSLVRLHTRSSHRILIGLSLRLLRQHRGLAADGSTWAICYSSHASSQSRSSLPSAKSPGGRAISIASRAIGKGGDSGSLRDRHCCRTNPERLGSAPTWIPPAQCH